MTIQSLGYLTALLLLWLACLSARSAPARQALLLAASYVFYASWGVAFLGVLVASSALNYGWGAVLGRRPTVRNLWIGIGLNLALLVFFKYLPPLAANVDPASLLARVALPVGISFWTFQGLSYLFDRYREEPLDPSALEFGLYMAFWPTVLAGPVCRLPEMLPQLRAAAQPAWGDAACGVRRIVIGLFLTLFLASVLGSGLTPGEGLDSGFDQMESGWSGLDAWTLAVGYGLLLFFDFAGYSHIAIGSARLFGIRLPENFDRPYLATTPAVFWTRWHMSLSFWIRDYVFLSLATLRREVPWRLFVVFLSMVIFGLWHGASGPFLVWGAYHGLLLVAHRQVQALMRRSSLSLPPAIESSLGWVATFAFICLGWLPFRAHDLGQAASLLLAALTPQHFFAPGLRPNVYIVTFLTVAGYFAYEAARGLLARRATEPLFGRVLWLLSPPYYAALIRLTIAWSKQETGFVYFQF